KVLLDVWRVTDFSGAAQGCEGQKVLWVPQQQLNNYQFPPANRAILTALQLSERLLITGKFSDTEECVQRTVNAVQQHGIRAVLLRAHQLAPVEYMQLAGELVQVCQQLKVQLLLNTGVTGFIEQADGLHLTSQRLLACAERPVGEHKLFGASCHNEAEVRHAVRIGVDYLTLSPVLPTPSHPGGASLGWEGLQALLQYSPVPVYALGGLEDDHLPQAKALGLLGIAGISAWW
ncbi:MAG TPA: thiamine phosphate synthase, partial [Pseudomonadales bacterium]|nr:thiamine phosphate synthase [Pseudomonadales bacterium]